MAKQESTVADNTTTPADATPPATEPVAQPFVKPAPQQPTTHAAYFAGDPNAQHADPAVNGDKGKDAKSEGKLFTQEELDAIVKERVSRVKNQFADYDDVKAKATAAEQAKLSADEQQAARLADLEKQANTLAQQTATLKLENAFLVAATEIGLPAKAALKLADLSKAEYDDSGTLTNAKALAEAVATEYPALVKRATSAPVVNPARAAEAVRTDNDRRRDLLGGGGGGNFFSGGRVIVPATLGTTGE